MKASLLKKEDSLLLFEPLQHHFKSQVLNDDDFVSKLRALCKEMSFLTELDRVGIWFFDSSKCNLYSHCLYDKSAKEFEKQNPIALSLFPEYWSLIRDSKIICSSNPRVDNRFSDFWVRYLEEKNVKSIINASVWAYGEVIGVISGSTTKERGAFTQELKELFSLSSEIVAQWFYQLSMTHKESLPSGVLPYKSYLKSLLRICAETVFSSSIDSVNKLIEVTKQSIQAKDIHCYVLTDESIDRFCTSGTNAHDIDSDDIACAHEIISQTKYLWLPTQELNIRGVPQYVNKFLINDKYQHLIIPFQSKHKKTPYLGVFVIGFNNTTLTFKNEILERCQFAVESVKTVLNHIHTQSFYREGIEISRAAFENSTVGMILLNKYGEVIRYNQAAKDICNFENKRRINVFKYLIGNHLVDEICFAKNKDAIEPFQTEAVITDQDGNQKKVILNFSPLSLDKRQEKYSLLQMIDITEKEKALKALADQKVFFKSVIDASPNYVFAKDINGKFVLANKAVADVYGISEEQLIGHTDADFNKDKTQVEKFLSDDSFVISTGKELYIYDEEVTDSTGETRYVDTIKMPLYSEEHKENIVLGISTDITARKKAEAEYKEWLSNLEHSQKLESLGLLASGIAHDFNNILQGVIGNASLSLELLDGDSKVKELTDGILFSALKASDITNQLLTYTGKGSFEPTYIDVREVVTETFKMIDRIVNKKANVVFKNCSESLPILGDKPKLHQIVLNLVTNAVESLQKNEGLVTVTTARVEAAAAERNYDISGSHTNGYALIEVSDNGSGISKDNVKRIFEPFYTTKVTGRGIGLSAVQGIVRSHGGFLKVESEINVGTVFSVIIPLTNNCNSSIPAASNHDTPVLPFFPEKNSILVIDDEAITREVCVSMLTYMHYNVIQAHDGLDGIEKFMNSRGDLVGIILDLTMPKMDGTEVYRKIRQEDPNIPILFSSGYSEHQISFNLKNMQNASFIQKPYTILEFKKIIQDALKNRNSIATQNNS